MRQFRRSTWQHLYPSCMHSSSLTLLYIRLSSALKPWIPSSLRTADVYAFLIVFVLPLNSAVNPLLYTFTTPKYRNQILLRGWNKLTSRTAAKTDGSAGRTPTQSGNSNQGRCRSTFYEPVANTPNAFINTFNMPFLPASLGRMFALHFFTTRFTFVYVLSLSGKSLNSNLSRSRRIPNPDDQWM